MQKQMKNRFFIIFFHIIMKSDGYWWYLVFCFMRGEMSSLLLWHVSLYNEIIVAASYGAAARAAFVSASSLAAASGRRHASRHLRFSMPRLHVTRCHGSPHQDAWHTFSMSVVLLSAWLDSTRTTSAGYPASSPYPSNFSSILCFILQFQHILRYAGKACIRYLISDIFMPAQNTFRAARLPLLGLGDISYRRKACHAHATTLILASFLFEDKRYWLLLSHLRKCL